MTLPVATSLFAIIAYIIVLTLVFSRRVRNDRAAQIFLLYVVDMLLLQGIYLMLSLTRSEREALFWYSLNIPLLFSQVVIFLFFTKVFLGFKHLAKWARIGIFAWLAAITAGILLKPDFIFSAVHHNPTARLYVPELDPWNTTLLLPILLPLLVITSDLIKGYRHTKSPLQRVQIQYLFLAILIVWLGAMANVSPVLRPYPIDVAANIVSGYLLAYAILRYRLLDISIVFRRGVLFAASVLIIGSSFFFTILFVLEIVPIQNEHYAWWVYLLFSAILAMVVVPLRDLIQQWMGQVVYKEKISGIAMIERISRNVAHILDPQELARTIIQDFTSTMSIQWAVFYLENNGALIQVANKGIEMTNLVNWDLDHPVSRWLHDRNEIVTIDTLNELLTRNKLTQTQWLAIQQTGMELVVPLRTRDKLIGVIGLGPHLTRQSYTQDDEVILYALAGPVAIALENARLYDTVQKELMEREQSGKEREALITELKNKNTELEQFTYTVSHDLKSPLITIRGFLGYLEKDALAGDEKKIKNDIVRIVQATEKMQGLLNELLELSRIGRMMNPPVEVPFSQLAHEAVELVQGRIQSGKVLVHIADNMASVYGDRVRLQEVVQNLVENAVKFIGTQAQPYIEIGQNGTDPEGKPVFYVQDNGIGIEPEHHQRIFGLFNKLDTHSEGTGIGLALVKRIVEVHGGRIWVESEGAGKGAKFIFTLPRSDDKGKQI